MTLEQSSTSDRGKGSTFIQAFSRSAPKTKYWFWIFLIFIGIACMMQPPIDYDFGWHYRYGDYFWQNGKLLTENLFTYTMTNYKWVNSYWLFEVTLVAIYKLVGPLGLTLFTSGLVYSALAFYIYKIKPANISKFGIFSVFFVTTLVFSAFNISVRPHYLSTVFDLLLLLILLKFPKFKVGLPFLFLIWGNFHAEFVLGLFIFGVYTVFSPDKKKNLTILFLSALATLINPAGINLAITLLKELTLPKNSFVEEWSTIDYKKYPIPFFIFTASLSIGLAATIAARKKLPFWYFIVALFFVAFSVKASYMFRLFSIFSVYPLLLLDLKINIPKFIKVVFGILVFVVLVFELMNKIPYILNEQAWGQNRKYPYDLVVYMKQNNIQGNIWNPYKWGGYLEWKAPENKYYIDGRMTQWQQNGDYIMKDYFYTAIDQTALYEADYIILQTGSEISKEVEKSGKVTKLYKDNIATLFRVS